jgi:hypothetical protein
MVLPHRPLKPQELVHPPKMGRYIRHILLHLHLTCGLLNDSASAHSDVQRPRHNLRDRNTTGLLHIRPGLRHMLGPLSEVFGRVYVLQLSNAWYFAWNLGCGFARNKEEMLVFRFFSGIGRSAPLAIGVGVLRLEISILRRFTPATDQI